MKDINEFIKPYESMIKNPRNVEKAQPTCNAAIMEAYSKVSLDEGVMDTIGSILGGMFKFFTKILKALAGDVHSGEKLHSQYPNYATNGAAEGTLAHKVTDEYMVMRQERINRVFAKDLAPLIIPLQNLDQLSYSSFHSDKLAGIVKRVRTSDPKLHRMMEIFSYDLKKYDISNTAHTISDVNKAMSSIAEAGSPPLFEKPLYEMVDSVLKFNLNLVEEQLNGILLLYLATKAISVNYEKTYSTDKFIESVVNAKSNYDMGFAKYKIANIDSIPTPTATPPKKSKKTFPPLYAPCEETLKQLKNPDSMCSKMLTEKFVNAINADYGLKLDESAITNAASDPYQSEKRYINAAAICVNIHMAIYSESEILAKLYEACSKKIQPLFEDRIKNTSELITGKEVEALKKKYKWNDKKDGLSAGDPSHSDD